MAKNTDNIVGLIIAFKTCATGKVGKQSTANSKNKISTKMDNTYKAVYSKRINLSKEYKNKDSEVISLMIMY